MSVSGIVLAVAERWPSAGRAILRFGATLGEDPSRPHWVIEELSRRLNRPVLRKFVLANGRRLYCDPRDVVGREIPARGYYEPETVAIIQSILGPGGVFVDVGAYVGHHSIVSADRVAPGGHVYAFEPDPVTFALLRRNVALNGLAHVTCVQSAVADREGSAQLFQGNVTAAPANSLGRTVHTRQRSVSVKVQSLDAAIRAHDIQRVDLIKVDVEGAELLVLKGAEHTLERFRPSLILEFSEHTSAFGYSLADITAFLKQRGYAIFRVGSPPLDPYVMRSDDPLYFNVFAVPESRAGAVRSLTTRS